jgi:hypothetical protein
MFVDKEENMTITGFIYIPYFCAKPGLYGGKPLEIRREDEKYYYIKGGYKYGMDRILKKKIEKVEYSRSSPFLDPQISFWLIDATEEKMIEKIKEWGATHNWFTGEEE